MTRWLRGRAEEWLAASQASRGGSSCWTEEEQREELREPSRDTAGRMHRLNGCWSSVAFQGEAVWKGSLKILTTRVIEQCSLLKRAWKLWDREGPGWDTPIPVAYFFQWGSTSQSPDFPESASPAGGQTSSTWAWHGEGRCGFKAVFHVFWKCPCHLTCSQSAFLPFE